MRVVIAEDSILLRGFFSHPLQFILRVCERLFPARFSFQFLEHLFGELILEIVREFGCFLKSL